MIEQIAFSDQPITVTTTGFQPLKDAIEVIDFDEMNLLLTVIAIVSGAIVVEIWTGMQNQSESGWVPVAVYSSQTGAASEKRTITGMLRYVRWKVSTLTGSAATFELTGVVRQYGA